MPYVTELRLYTDISEDTELRCSVKNNPEFNKFVVSNTIVFRQMFDELSCEESAIMTKKFDQYKIEWRFINCLVQVFLIEGTSKQTIEFQTSELF